MESFRDFTAGPDPFGRSWRVQFKWLQTAISLRHSDSVDVKFRLSTGGEVEEKVIALPHPDLVTLCEMIGRELTDAWCSRLAAAHLRCMIETGEDMEKELVTVSADQLAEYNAALSNAAMGAA